MECSTAPPSQSPNSLPSNLTTSHTCTIVPQFFQPVISPGLAVTSVTTVVYASLILSSSTVSGVVRGSLPALQRAVAAQRLAGLCLAARGNVDDGSGASSNSDDGVFDDVLFNTLAEDPTTLHFNVAVGGLDYAAGAVIGNVLVVAALSVVSHGIAAGRFLLDGKESKLARVAYAIAELPSSTFPPGALALPYATLVQPSIAACVALISSGGSGGAIALGTVMLLMWVSVPVYFGWQVLWRCRVVIDGRNLFVLQARASESHLRRGSVSAHCCRRCVTERKWYSHVFLPTRTWVSRVRTKVATSFLEMIQTRSIDVSAYTKQRLEPLYSSYVEQREWYFLVDWGVAIGSAVFLGVAYAMANQHRKNNDDGGSVSTDVCVAAKIALWSSVICGIIQLCLYFIFRPFQVRLDMYVGVAVGVLTVVSQALALADELDASQDVSLAATAVQLLVMVVNVVCELLGAGRVSCAQEQGGSPGTSSSSPSHKSIAHSWLDESSTQRRTRAFSPRSVERLWMSIESPRDKLAELVRIICEQRQNKHVPKVSSTRQKVLVNEKYVMS